MQFSTSNTKLKKDGIISFNLPAGYSLSVQGLRDLNKELVKRGKPKAFPDTYLKYRDENSPEAQLICRGAKGCLGLCYARQGTFKFIMSVVARELNYMYFIMDDEGFKQRAIKKINNMKVDKIIRPHDSGDFFNQAYLDFWFDIMRACPTKQFYAYTKSLDLDFSDQPANFNITQSLGGKFDSMVDLKESHARIFSSDKARKQAGYKDGNKSDMLAVKGVQNIGLVYHGGRNLTEKQMKEFN